MQIYDIGEWRDLRWAISMRRMGRQPETVTIHIICFLIQGQYLKKPLINYLQVKTFMITY